MQAKNLVKQLKSDYPQFNFQISDQFLFRPEEQTIFYIPNQDATCLIHELAHAILQHFDYEFDIELLKIESEAWQLTSKLATRYNLKLPHKFIDQAMDSYRDWLDCRSRCPKCDTVGFQLKNGKYQCLECRANWQPNLAKHTALRRKLLS